MPPHESGSAQSPIVVSDDEEDSIVVERELADRITTPSPRQSDFGEYSPNHAHHWDRVEDRKVDRFLHDPLSDDDDPNDHYGRGTLCDSYLCFMIVKPPAPIGHPRVGQKRGWDSMTPGGEYFPPPQRKRSMTMSSHHSNGGHPPVSHSNPPLESRAARKKRRKRERLAAEVDAQSKTPTISKSSSNRPPKTYQIPTIPSSSRPHRSLPRGEPSRRPSLPLPAKPSATLLPPLPFSSDSMASSMIPPAVTFPNLPPSFSFSSSTTHHTLPLIPPQSAPILSFTSSLSVPLPPKPKEALIPPPAPAPDSLPELQPVPISSLPKKQIGMQSESDTSGKHGTYALPKSSPLPDPARTLIMELMPKKFRTPLFVRNWAMSIGTHPRGSPPRIDLDLRTGKALIEFANRDLASLGWASPRLPIGDGKEHIRVWWYRDSNGHRAELEEGEIEEVQVQATGVTGSSTVKKEKGKGKPKESKSQHQQQGHSQGRSSRSTEGFPHQNSSEMSVAYNCRHNGPVEPALRDIKEAPPPPSVSSASIGAAWLNSQAFRVPVPTVNSVNGSNAIVNGDMEEAMDLSSEDGYDDSVDAPSERPQNSTSLLGSLLRAGTDSSISSSRPESPIPRSTMAESARYDQAERGLLSPRVTASTDSVSVPSALFRAPYLRKLSTSFSSSSSYRAPEVESVASSVASLPPSEGYPPSDLASSVSSVASPPLMTPIDTPSYVGSRSPLRTPTPPPRSEARREQKTPKANGFGEIAQVPVTRKETIEERLAKSKEEFAARQASVHVEPPTPTHNNPQDTIMKDNSNDATNSCSLVMPNTVRSTSPVSLFPRSTTEETLRMKVLASKRSRTLPIPAAGGSVRSGIGSAVPPKTSPSVVPSESNAQATSSAVISSSPLAQGSLSTDPSPIPASYSSITSTSSTSTTTISASASCAPTVVSKSEHLMTSHLVTQSEVNLEALADSFISDAIRNMAPLSSLAVNGLSSNDHTRSASTPTPTPQSFRKSPSPPSAHIIAYPMKILSEKEILSRKQELMTRQLSESRSLMQKMSAAKTKVERSALSVQFKECTRCVGVSF